MIFFDEERVLIIPNGLGNLTKTESKGYEEGYAAGIEKGKTIQRVEDAAKLEERTFVKNGVYTPEYGYKKVRVDVDTTDAFNEGYNAGKEAQRAEDDSNLEEIVITENGEYVPDYGYSNVIVNVEGSDCPELEAEVERLEEENAELTAENERKSKLQTKGIGITGSDYVVLTPDEGFYAMDKVEIFTNSKVAPLNVTVNGSYRASDYEVDGFSDVNVNVPSECEELVVVIQGLEEEIEQKDEEIKTLTEDVDAAYARGITDQKAKLTSTTINANGTYTREDGWNEVNVNVPSADDKLLEIVATLYQIAATSMEYKYSSTYNIMAGTTLTISRGEEAVIIDYDGNLYVYRDHTETVTHLCAALSTVYLYSNNETTKLTQNQTLGNNSANLYAGHLNENGYIPSFGKVDMFYMPEYGLIIGSVSKEVRFHTKDKPIINRIVNPDTTTLYFPMGTYLGDLRSQYPTATILEY